AQQEAEDRKRKELSPKFWHLFKEGTVDEVRAAAVESAAQWESQESAQLALGLQRTRLLKNVHAVTAAWDEPLGNVFKTECFDLLRASEWAAECLTAAKAWPVYTEEN